MHTRIKICGVTNPADLRAIADAGADAIGLNFHAPSPRSIRVEDVSRFLDAMPPFVEAVGVFVRQSPAESAATMDARLRTFQVHGGEGLILPRRNYRYVPAFAVRDEADVSRLLAYLEAAASAGGLPDAVLIDGHAPGMEGGTGRVAPWRLLDGLVLPVPLILAGGLTPENVAEAVARVRPYAVDTASGVEATPGAKDIAKVRAFVAAVRGTSVAVT